MQPTDEHGRACALTDTNNDPANNPVNDNTPETAGSQVRVLAARAVSSVMDDGRSLDVALANLPADMAAADRGLCRMLAYGTLRDYRRLEALLEPRLQRAPQPLLKALLLIGIFQLDATRVPAHAAVHATVSATEGLGLGKARGMVNAILRGHQRGAPRGAGRAAEAEEAEESQGMRYSYPDWLVDAIEEDWGGAADQVLAAGNQQAPMHLRVNRRRTTRDAYLAQLTEQGLTGTPLVHCDQGLTLAEPVGTDRLPGFADGLVSVQDAAAQLAAGLLGLRDGQRVLDACAAPGNKSAHLLEQADIDLVALDVDERRLATLDTNLARLGLSARTHTADALATADWWDGQLFDRILLDAPCSGTGVIRRHPDIKWLRRPDDIDEARRRQEALLDALWPTLAPGGQLLYATCSILRFEGSDVIADFAAREPSARVQNLHVDWGWPEAVGKRIRPGQSGMDGFYYALIERAG